MQQVFVELADVWGVLSSFYKNGNKDANSMLDEIHDAMVNLPKIITERRNDNEKDLYS